MSTLHDWKTKEKQFYSPVAKPVSIIIPEMKFFTIEGKGNPNNPDFQNYIEVLYTLAYGVRMWTKSAPAPTGYFEYKVYPLEGIWDITEEARLKKNEIIDKNDLVFKLMIRQPDFVTPEFYSDVLAKVKKKKTVALLSSAVFETITDGNSVQMMHIGSYDNEPESFKLMETFCRENGLIRESKIHREIYLSDFRKTAPEKLKTVLRFGVK